MKDANEDVQRVVDDALYVFMSWAERPEYGLHALPRLFESLRTLDVERYNKAWREGISRRQTTMEASRDR